MTSRRRPIAVTLIALLYIAVGAIGFVAHLPFLQGRSFHNEDVLIELTEVLALASGIYLLRGANWARWLAFLWILFHIALSIGHSPAELGMHIAFAAAIGWILFRPPGAGYFTARPA